MYLLIWLFTTRLAVYGPLDLLGRDRQSYELLAPFRRAIVVSRETTYLTEPRLPAGRGVDYVAALNAHRGNGVTFENNAVVPLLRLCPPKFKSKELRERFFRMLGGQIEFLRAEKLVSLEEFDARLEGIGDSVWADSNNGTGRPLNDAEQSLIAAWRQRNRNALCIIESAIRRQQHFLPAVGTPADG